MICLKIRTFVVSATTNWLLCNIYMTLWFAWKFVPLWYQQQPQKVHHRPSYVVICLKIRTFVVSATTKCNIYTTLYWLWFAWKFVPLWYQQQLFARFCLSSFRCDLLENSYLCGISNNTKRFERIRYLLWFAWKFVPLWYQQQQVLPSDIQPLSCDLLENSYLCGISNNFEVDC